MTEFTLMQAEFKNMAHMKKSLNFKQSPLQCNRLNM